MHKRSIMTLYSGQNDVYSHQVRIVLAEKGVNIDIISTDFTKPPAELSQLNPYSEVPTLVDRELALYNPQIIMEYLDERFPHPPLLPVYPIMRAKSRLMMHRIQRDWYTLIDKMQQDDKKTREDTRHEFTISLVNLSPLFQDFDYFMSNDFSLIDCAIAPLLWRLPHYEITLPKSAKAIVHYMERIFERPSFQASLTDAEQELRESDDH